MIFQHSNKNLKKEIYKHIYIYYKMNSQISQISEIIEDIKGKISDAEATYLKFS